MGNPLPCLIEGTELGMTDFTSGADSGQFSVTSILTGSYNDVRPATGRRGQTLPGCSSRVHENRLDGSFPDKVKAM
jgi:hypothetical protein